MTAHAQASPESSHFCDILFEELRRRIPKLERKKTQQWCALFEPGRNRFAYVSHRKRSQDLEVWCSGDINALLKHGGIKVVPRTSIKGGWEEQFPARFVLSSPHHLDGACRLLHDVSFRSS